MFLLLKLLFLVNFLFINVYYLVLLRFVILIKVVSFLLLSVLRIVSDFIKVPCGHCKQCVAVAQMYFVQRAMMEKN